MFESGRVDVVVSKLLAQFLAALLVDPDGQQFIETFGRDVEDEFAGLLGVFLEWYLTSVSQADITIGRRDDDRNTITDRFGHSVFACLFLGFGLGLRTFLPVSGVSVELGILELTRTGVVK